MGTHGALLIRREDGTLKRIEATGDGDEVIDVWRNWVLAGTHIPPKEIFGWSSAPEINEEGEGNQEYACIIDFHEKKYACAWNITRRDFGMMKTLEALGWEVLEEKSPLWEVLVDPFSWSSLIEKGKLKNK